MLKYLFLGMYLLIGHFSTVQAQKYFSKTATIVFDAEGKLDDVEDIKAKTGTASCVYDAATGNFEWSVTIKNFSFANSLMQEHFNENYMESEKFPKATFKGKVENISALNLKKDGTYPVKVLGKLTMHGVTKDISVNGTFKVAKDQMTANSDFEVALKDYEITIPTIVLMKVAENVKISVSAPLQVLK
jgi:polyisoprenoid-binding protein YceI